MSSKWQILIIWLLRSTSSNRRAVSTSQAATSKWRSGFQHPHAPPTKRETCMPPHTVNSRFRASQRTLHIHLVSSSHICRLRSPTRFTDGSRGVAFQSITRFNQAPFGRRERREIVESANAMRRDAYDFVSRVSDLYRCPSAPHRGIRSTPYRLTKRSAFGTTTSSRPCSRAAVQALHRGPVGRLFLEAGQGDAGPASPSCWGPT